MLAAIAVVTLGDAAAGFYFRVVGVWESREAGSLPITNMVMGPPVFAPLLFGISAYLGLIASFLRRGENSGNGLVPLPAHRHHWARALTARTRPSAGSRISAKGGFRSR